MLVLDLKAWRFCEKPTECHIWMCDAFWTGLCAEPKLPQRLFVAKTLS